ncbi:unnamed protein product [Closterium sp. NIES-64]|nr:unnamed protein product [Closterium sp. NIES-64]
MPASDRYASGTRVSSILTPRRITPRTRARMHHPATRHFHPGRDTARVPFFFSSPSDHDDISPAVPRADALFVPRDNPRALFIRHPVAPAADTAAAGAAGGADAGPNGKSPAAAAGGTPGKSGSPQGSDYQSPPSGVSPRDALYAPSAPPYDSSELNGNGGSQSPRSPSAARAGATGGGFGSAMPSPTLSPAWNGSFSPPSPSRPTGTGAKGPGIESQLPRLKSADYFTEPSLSALAALERSLPGSLARVRDFVVGRKGFGSVRFLGETDVRGLDVEGIVQFHKCEILVYMDEESKPPVGEELNKPAEVTLLQVVCVDKKTGKAVTEGPEVERFERKLRRKTAEQEAEFLSFNAAKGEWRFKVQHFSRYGLEDSDDDEEEEERGRGRGEGEEDGREDDGELGEEEYETDEGLSGDGDGDGDAADDGNGDGGGRGRVSVPPGGVSLDRALPAQLGIDPIRLQQMRQVMFGRSATEEDNDGDGEGYNGGFGSGMGFTSAKRKQGGLGAEAMDSDWQGWGPGKAPRFGMLGAAAAAATAASAAAAAAAAATGGAASGVGMARKAADPWSNPWAAGFRGNRRAGGRVAQKPASFLAGSRRGVRVFPEFEAGAPGVGAAGAGGAGAVGASAVLVSGLQGRVHAHVHPGAVAASGFEWTIPNALPGKGTGTTAGGAAGAAAGAVAVAQAVAAVAVVATVAGEGSSGVAVDAGLFLGRSFRVGWGPGGVLVTPGRVLPAGSFAGGNCAAADVTDVTPISSKITVTQVAFSPWSSLPPPPASFASPLLSSPLQSLSPGGAGRDAELSEAEAERGAAEWERLQQLLLIEPLLLHFQSSRVVGGRGRGGEGVWGAGGEEGDGEVLQSEEEEEEDVVKSGEDEEMEEGEKNGREGRREEGREWVGRRLVCSRQGGSLASLCRCYSSLAVAAADALAAARGKTGQGRVVSGVGVSERQLQHEQAVWQLVDVLFSDWQGRRRSDVMQGSGGVEMGGGVEGDAGEKAGDGSGGKSGDGSMEEEERDGEVEDGYGEMEGMSGGGQKGGMEQGEGLKGAGGEAALNRRLFADDDVEEEEEEEEETQGGAAADATGTNKQPQWIGGPETAEEEEKGSEQEEEQGGVTEEEEEEEEVEEEERGDEDEEEAGEEEQEEYDEETMELFRRAEFSAWLQAVVAPAIVHELNSLAATAANPSTAPNPLTSTSTFTSITATTSTATTAAAASADAAALPLRVAFTALTGMQVETAVGAAALTGDVRLAALLSLAHSAPAATRADAARQLALWERLAGGKGDRYGGSGEGAISLQELAEGALVSVERLRLLRLVAGDVTGALEGRPLDWKRHLGLLMWFGMTPAEPLGSVIGEFRKRVRVGRVPRAIPWYEQTIGVEGGERAEWERIRGGMGGGKGKGKVKGKGEGEEEVEKGGVEDVLYGLLALHLKEEMGKGKVESGDAGDGDDVAVDVAAMLRWRSWTRDALDCHLTWHLQSVLQAIGVLRANEVLPAVHMDYVAQLLAANQPHWALYCLQHVPPSRKLPRWALERAFREVLAVSCPVWAASEEQRSFIEGQLLVPRSWMCAAQAVHHRYEGRRSDELQCLLGSFQWDRAHRLFMSHLAAAWILSERWAEVQQLMEGLETHGEAIYGWKEGGRLLLDYMHLSAALEGQALVPTEELTVSVADGSEALSEFSQRTAQSVRTFPHDAARLR